MFRKKKLANQFEQELGKLKEPTRLPLIEATEVTSARIPH